MKKTKFRFACKNCGVESPKWIGKCPSCKEWNTFVEEIVSVKAKQPLIPNTVISKPYKIHDIPNNANSRILTQDSELNQVLGGGFVAGSLVLLGGEPGIGKSTFALQVALNLQLPVVYVSGEESSQQIKLRCQRLNLTNDSCWILNETNLETIFNHLQNINPAFVIIDSIQTSHTDTIDSSAGSISQIKESTGLYLKYAKTTNTTMLLIGHITKEGHIAGPKVLEHMVDVVLQLEGDDKQLYRILRASKNRYGSTAEMGMYQMKRNGLQIVENISSLLLSRRSNRVSGIALAGAMEGRRTFIIEVQSLVSNAVYGNPQRTTTGINYKRLNMLLAVVENRLGFKFATKDVFLNIAGGINVKDTAIDVAVIVAIISSYLNRIVPSAICFIGEVSLSGDVRPASHTNARIKEAYKNGMTKVFTPYSSDISFKAANLSITYVETLKDVFRQLFRTKR